MNLKAKIRIAVDVLMTFLLLFLMGYQFWGEKAHEWVGASMFILFILHHILNRGWYKALFKGKYTPMRIFQLVVDTAVMVSMLMLMYSGIVMSRYAFSFLPISGGLALARKLHILGSYWGFLLMSIHLGMHWNMVIGMAGKLSQTKEHPKLFSVIMFIAGAVVAVYGVSAFIRRNFLTYLFLKNEFVFLDYDESPILFYIDYLALMGLCVFVSHYASKLFRKKRREVSE